MFKQAIKWCLWIAAFFGIFTIFGEGWIKVIGVLSVIWMAGSTIATCIDESKED